MMPNPTTILRKLLRRGSRGTGSNDSRSGRFVAVIECVLNQNVRDSGAACFPAMNFELLQLCHQHSLGVLQLPCPEIAALGPGRERPPGQSLREALDSERGQGRCRELAASLADRIVAYVSQGGQLVAVLGGNPRSPGCAVHAGPNGLREESGVFLKALQSELRARELDPVFGSMRDCDPALLSEDMERFRELLVASSDE